MKSGIRKTVRSISLLLAFVAVTAFGECLWDNQPTGERSSSCYPIGNGRLGAMISGGANGLYLKGLRGFTAEEAFDAVKTSLTVDHFESDWSLYTKYGYVPFDRIPGEGVSRTLEYAYNDACAARFAEVLGKKEDAAYFGKRALFYRNLFCPETGFMRGRDAQGNWRTPFDPLKVNHNATSGGDYTEGNAWQYMWHVQHDREGLIALMGGREVFCEKPAKLFTLNSKVEGIGTLVDVSGLIGQYAHGNEPSHHVAYFFALAGQPWRTQELIRKIVDTQYGIAPDGLCGNDDCGQMSAWYLFSVMGFYPFDPCGGGYVLGAPQVRNFRLKHPDGKKFTLEAKNLSKDNLYVKQVFLNNKLFSGTTLSHKTVMAGGRLVFEMGRQKSISPYFGQTAMDNFINIKTTHNPINILTTPIKQRPGPGQPGPG